MLGEYVMIELNEQLEIDIMKFFLETSISRIIKRE